MKITLFESNDNGYLLPLTYFCHVAELKIGTMSIRDAWHTLDFETSLAGRSYLRTEQWDEADANIWVNSRVLPSASLKTHLLSLKPGHQLCVGDLTVAFHVETSPVLTEDGFVDTRQFTGLVRNEIDDTSYLHFPWDIFRFNSQLLHDQSAQYHHHNQFPEHIHRFNPEQIYIHPSACVYPGVVLEATDGPVIIDEDAVVFPNSYLKGPIYIGKHSQVKANTFITNSSIFDHCKVSGEISTSVIQDYSNKAHDGFLGQSVLGRWVNLGAGTTTSNLKNNYSPIRMEYFGESIQTNELFIGSIIGDHSKTAIGSILNTGTIIGTNANIFGSGAVPKTVSSFSWGGKLVNHVYDLAKAIETATRVMKRRNIEFSEIDQAQFEAVFRFASTHRLSDKPSDNE